VWPIPKVCFVASAPNSKLLALHHTSFSSGGTKHFERFRQGMVAPSCVFFIASGREMPCKLSSKTTMSYA
jgi:hypothetical protein